MATYRRWWEDAYAVHDLRSKFAPVLWSGVTDLKTQSLEQLWFAGAHADVGGGYDVTPSPGTKFSDDALSWMRDEASANGLQISCWCPQSSYASDFTPHITHPAHELIGPAMVRKALYNVDRGNQRLQRLHASALQRLFAPVSSLYDTLDSSVREKWIEADAAIMQLHYDFYFPMTKPELALSPAALQEDRDNLRQIIWGTRQSSLEEVTRIMRLIVAFDIKFFDHVLTPILPGRVARLLEAATRIVESELRDVNRGSIPFKVESTATSVQMFRLDSVTRSRVLDDGEVIKL